MTARFWLGSCRVNSCALCKHGSSCTGTSSWQTGFWLRPARPRTKSIRCEVAMHWDVSVVRPLENYEIYVELKDGRRGIFDLKPYMHHGIFRELEEYGYFAQAA